MSNNDSLKLAFEIKSINHEIESIGVKFDFLLTSFIKSLYLSYLHYLESLQASGKLKDIDFDKLVGKIAEREKAFGKKEASHSSNTETLYLAQKYRKPQEESFRNTRGNRGRGRKNYRGRRGRNIQGDRQQNEQQINFSDKPAIKCFRCGNLGHTTANCRIPCDKIN